MNKTIKKLKGVNIKNLGYGTKPVIKLGIQLTNIIMWSSALLKDKVDAKTAGEPESWLRKELLRIFNEYLIAINSGKRYRATECILKAIFEYSNEIKCTTFGNKTLDIDYLFEKIVIDIFNDYMIKSGIDLKYKI